MTGVVDSIVGSYNYLISILPNGFAKFVNLFLLVILILIYVFFVWKFSSFISRKNLIDLNLNQYNKSKHPFFEKIFAGVYYIIEYIVVLPFIVFLWFAVFTIFMILMNQSLPLDTVLLVSASVVTVIRIASYYSKELARNVALILPFNLLAFSLLTPGFFQFEQIIGNLSRAPTLISDILIYLVFIIGLEILLRIFEFFLALFGLEDLSIDDSD